MKIKFIIQLILGILVGYMVKAGEPFRDKQSLPVDNPCYHHTTDIQAAIGYQDDPASFTTQAPRHKQLKCRTRLRGVATFTVSPAPAQGETRSFDYCDTAEPLHGSYHRLILPFYYIFLFRFTPF